MSDIFVEIIGWSGSALILIAYALLSSRRISSEQFAYHIINVVGAFLLATYGVLKDASATVFLNVVWLFIGVYALYIIKKTLNKLSE